MKIRGESNRVFILDGSKIITVLDDIINDIDHSLLQTNKQQLTYRNIHLIKKLILNNSVIKIMNDTNDSPVYPLATNDFFIDNLIVDNERVNYLDTILFSLYNNTFRFFDNVEVSVDTIISNNNIYVYTYEHFLV